MTGFLGAAGALLVAAAALTQETPFKPVASITELMQAMVIPASNALFNVPRQPPNDDQGWTEVRHHAIVLAESGNLLMIGNRAQPSEVWRETSRALTKAGEAALKAAQDKDVDALTEVGNQIIEACESCHEKHWIR